MGRYCWARANSVGNDRSRFMGFTVKSQTNDQGKRWRRLFDIRIDF